MDPTTRSAASPGDGGRTATRLTRRVANAAALAVVAFWALFVFSAELPAVRAHSPWAEDPYDAGVSLAALLVPLVTVVTFIRYFMPGPSTFAHRMSYGDQPAVKILSDS
jgi:hypothetical protein